MRGVTSCQLVDRPDWSPFRRPVKGRAVNYNLFLLLTATAVGGAAGATAIYAGQSPNRSGSAATMIAGLAASVLATIVVATREGSEFFSMLHLYYLIGTIGIPMAGLGLLINWKHQQFLGRFVGAMAVLVAPLGIYASHIEPFWLRLDDVALPAPASMAGLRIGVLADLQTTEIGEYERNAITELISQGPDIVLIPGDFWQMSPAEFEVQAPSFAAELARLDAAVPHVFMVKGNTDTLEGLRQLAVGTNVVVLDNEVADVVVNGQAVRIGGITLAGDENRAAAAIQQLTDRANGAFVPPVDPAGPEVEELSETTTPPATQPPVTDPPIDDSTVVGQVDQANPDVTAEPTAPVAPDVATTTSQDDGVFRILLAHKPDEIERLPGDDSVNLVVAGHTHGGQVRFPGFPPPLIMSSVPRTVGGGGLHRLDDHWIYVSTGVGRERGRAPQVRFLARPSIGVLTTVDVTTVVLPDN